MYRIVVFAGFSTTGGRMFVFEPTPRTKYIPGASAVIEYSPLIHTMFYWRTAAHRFYVFVEHSDLGCVDLSSCFLNF